MTRLSCWLVGVAAVAGHVMALDWPQWRGGAQRSGSTDAPVLNGAKLIEAWRSEALPDGYGEQRGQVVGQGSPVIHGGKVYLYVNWPDPASVTARRFKFPDRATDTVLCLDLATGKTLWKTDRPGRAWRWGCSATVAVADGKVVALGSTGDGFCLDAQTGREVWHWVNPDVKQPATNLYANVIGEFQSSALIHDGLAVLSTRAANGLVALDLVTGQVRWRAEKLKGDWAAPVAWRHAGGWTLIDRGCGFDPATGAVRWRGLPTGMGTPAIEGDFGAVMSGKGLSLYRLTTNGPVSVATIPLDNAAGCPAIRAGRVYACGAKKLLCAEVATGAVEWETTGDDLALGGGQWSFTAPVVTSNVVAVLDGRSAVHRFAAATGQRLGQTNVDALRCTSFAVAGNTLVTRGWKAVVCYQGDPR